MQSITNVFSNSFEDTIDDFVSSYLFSEMRTVSQPLIETGDNLTLLDEAKNNFITQTFFGLTLWGYMHVMRLIEKIIIRTGLTWSYIVSGKVQKVVVDRLNKIKSKNIKGKKAIKYLSAIVGSDKTLERIEIAKIVNTNINQIDKQMQGDKTNKLFIEQKMATLGASVSQIKGISSQENFNLYLHKTKTSTWTNTTKDKKLFEKVTGQLIADFKVTWSDMVETINNYSEFAKDVEGRIFNLTEAILKIVNRTNLAK